jgi:hypothetical protein
MADQIITKQCSKCKQIKPISEFSKRKEGILHRRSWCKNCERIRNCLYHRTEKCKNRKKKYFQTQKGKEIQKKSSHRHRQLFPEQIKAQNAVMNAIKVGKLPKAKILKCFYCPRQANEYHHHLGYEIKYRLDIIPVCRFCHRIFRKT